MSFHENEPQIVVLEDLQPVLPHSQMSHMHGNHSHLPPHVEHIHGGHAHMPHHHLDEASTLSVSDNDADIEIVVLPLEGIPGAGLEHELPPLIVVDDEDEYSKDSKQKESKDQSSDKNDARFDENDAKKSKKQEKWDWESKGAEGFISWIKERIEGVPKHSGMDTAGLERAISYLEKLDSEISKAMRLDLDGDLDANKIEEVRSKIDDGLARLHDRLEKVKKTKKKYKNKKADENFELNGIVKEAQKITGVQGIYVTVPLLISRIARVCINGMVSGGHDIEDLYDRQVKLYKLNTREKAEVMQLLADMGYALRQDRGFMPEDALEVSDSDGMDWNSNYKG